MSAPAFQQYQAAFCAHLRNPAEHPRPEGVPASRIRVYSSLLINNIDTTLAACFPVCKRVIGVRRWRPLVKRFFAEHRATAPLFRQIPEEFLRWLAQADNTGLPPFFLQLAHYEWVELALSVSDACPEPHDPDGDLLTGRPVLAPALMLLRYDWPVQRITPRFKPQQALTEPLWMLVFRDADDSVRFIELNAVSARVVELLAAGSQCGREILQTVAGELQHPDPSNVVHFGQDLFLRLKRQGALLGTRL